MTTNRTPPFAGFEEVALPEGAAELVFGVNVLQIQASVRTTENGTVAELVAKYRDQLNLPADVVVFVDGIKMSPGQRLPDGYQRVELVKPAGSKGVQTLADTPTIPLEDSDAVKIVIAAEDTVKYTRWFLDGAIDVEVVPFVQFSGERKILKTAHGKSYVGHPEVFATRNVLRPLAEIKRRIEGGVAESGELSINDVVRAQHAKRVELNGEPSNCVSLKAGDTLVVVVDGQTSAEDYTRVFTFAADLAKMNGLTLRALGLRYGVKVAGKGRTMQVIAGEILKVEFPDLPDDPDFVEGLLKKNEE